MCRYELAFSPKTVAHWPSPNLLEGRALIPSLNEAVRNRMCLSLDRFRARVPNLVSTFRIRHASFSIIIIIIKDGWVNLLLDHVDFLFYGRLAFFLFHSQILVIIILYQFFQEFLFYLIIFSIGEKSLKYRFRKEMDIISFEF